MGEALPVASRREREAPPNVEIKHSALVLNVRPGVTEAKKKEVLERWYRDQIKEITPRLIAKWERVIGVRVNHFYVQRMKTKWGSCSAPAGTIRLNSELAKKPQECLEYIVVHEIVHLLERTHNRRFISLMEQFMPLWQSHRELLNRLPVRREKWVYQRRRSCLYSETLRLTLEIRVIDLSTEISSY